MIVPSTALTGVMILMMMVLLHPKLVGWLAGICLFPPAFFCQPPLHITIIAFIIALIIATHVDHHLRGADLSVFGQSSYDFHPMAYSFAFRIPSLLPASAAPTPLPTSRTTNVG